MGANFFSVRPGVLSEEEFLEDVKDMIIDFTLYEKSKYILIAMMALKPETEEDEREAILASLDSNHNIDVTFIV